MLDRLQPSVIPCLSKLGVQKISCGRNHCLALTLTGTVFGWGDNSTGQSCPQVSLAVCSIPQVINLPIGETGADVCAAENFSFVLTDAGNVFGFGSDDKNARFVRQITVTSNLLLLVSTLIWPVLIGKDYSTLSRAYKT